jgi:hypothetical protein
MAITFDARAKRGRPAGTSFLPREADALAKMTELILAPTPMTPMDAAEHVWQEAIFQSANKYAVKRRLCRRWRSFWST